MRIGWRPAWHPSAALRESYDATMCDPAFLAETKMHDMTIRPQSGGEIAALVGKAAATPKPVLQRTAQILGWLK